MAANGEKSGAVMVNGVKNKVSNNNKYLRSTACKPIIISMTSFSI